MAKTAQVATKNEKNVVKGNKKKESANVPAMKAKKQQAAHVGILKNNIDAKILQPEKNGKKNSKDDDEDDSEESLETPNGEESNDIDNAEMGSNSDDVENDEDSEDAQQSHDEESDEDDDGDEVDDEDEVDGDVDEVDDDGDGDEVDEDDDEADEEEEGSDNEGPEEITVKQEKNVRDVPDKNYIKNEDPKKSKNKSNRARQILVNGLKNSITVDQISKHFVSCGKIELVQIVPKGKFTGAVVVFEDESAIKSALKLHSSILDDGNITVCQSYASRTTYSQRNTVIVLNSEGLTKLEPSKLENVLSKCGEIQELTIVCKPKILAFVVFKNPESVSKALKLDGTEQNGLQLKIAPYTIKSGKTKIFVKNIEKGTTEDHLRDLFEICGPIKCIRMKNNAALPSTAIIDFENSESYCQSFLLHEKFFRGRLILLEPFSEKTKPRFSSNQSNQSNQFSSKSFTEQVNYRGPNKFGSKSFPKQVNYRGPNKFSKTPFNGKRPHTGMWKKEFPAHTGMWKKEFPPQKRFKN